MTLLVLSISALLLGPFLAKLFERKPGVNRFLDGFILVTIGGIAMIHLLPEAVVQIGGAALLMVVLGALLPYFAERAFHSFERATHSGVLVLALSGILIHTMMDGIALSSFSTHDDTGMALALAVILHRLPIGLLIWWAIKPVAGMRTIIVVLTLMSLGTVAGFIVGEIEFPFAHSNGLSYFQSLVTGSLLHVLFHRHIHKKNETEHEHSHPDHRKVSAIPAAVGALMGAGLLFFLPLGGSLPHDHSIDSTAHVALSLFLKSAPALLLGFVIAAGIQNFIPEAGMSWLKSKNRSIRVSKGMLFGLPLPICSCGVVPLYHSLVRRGVPMGAAIAFLIATPELGVDAILISIPLLGVKMTLIRLGAAALIAWGTGYIMDLLVPSQEPEELPTIETDQLEEKRSGLAKFWHTLNHELIDHLGPWVLLGLIIAAIADPYLAEQDWTKFSYGLDILVMALVGMPLYVCATGATPIAAVMLMNGVSAGAVLAFLITGPATNITTLGVIKKLHSTRVAVLFPVVIVTLTILVGLAVNLMLGESSNIMVDNHLHDEFTFLNITSSLVLALLFVGSLFRIGPRGMLENLYEGLGSSEEEGESCDCHDH